MPILPAVALLILVGCTLGQDNFNSTLSLFHHRAYHNSILIGDYIYIDGGEITQWNAKGDGEEDVNDDSGIFLTLPDNYTYSIDMSGPWTTDTVTLKQIAKGSAPVLNDEGLWPEFSGESFYAYGGAVSYAYDGGGNDLLPVDEIPDPPDNELWQFTPSGDGAGEWSEASISPSSNFSTLVRTVSPAYGYGGGFGWSIGGQQNAGTDRIYAVNYVTLSVPGMVMFDTHSQDWYNLSTDAISYYGTVINGATHYVPTFGPKGLLFMLGGVAVSGRISFFPNLLPHPPFYFNNLNMYDPSSQQWLSQATTGDVPNSVQFLCAVGLEGDDDTYEIFVYGGSAEDIFDSLSEGTGAVYVLSLPSFHWTRQDYTPKYTRRLHTCNVAGNRQMVVIGGEIITADSGLASDPWPVGIGVFDLSEMQWSDSYDPSASRYVTPQAVKSHIESNGRYPAAWSDDTVKSLFMNQTSSLTYSPSPHTSKSSHGSSNTGAIAGGVVGGVLGLAAMAAVIYYVLRKRMSTHGRSGTSPDYTGLARTNPDYIGHGKAELDNETTAYEMEHPYRALEIDNGVYPELEGGWQGHEVRGVASPVGQSAVGH